MSDAELVDAIDKKLLNVIAKATVLKDAVEGLKNTSAASENEDLCLALQQHNDLVEQYSTGCKEVAEAKARLWALKRKTLEARLDNKELAGELDKLREECTEVPASLRSVRSEERSLKYRITVLRNVLLALIHESGGNWANDPDLVALVISLQNTLPSSEP